MERKLELRDICGYLPYGLYVDTKLSSGMYCNVALGVYRESDIFIQYRDTYIFKLLSQTKPILRPLSDLYRTITHNGKEIIPIVELAKIAYPKHKDFKCEDKWVLLSVGKSPYYCFEFVKSGSFICSTLKYERFCLVPNQVQLFDYLNELKVDFRGLIDAGLAIDANTLETNPYK